MDTKTLISAMVRENTGSHFLDSGMFYGYKYNDPLPAEAVTATVTPLSDSDGFDITFSISTVAFLKATLNDGFEAPLLEEQFQAMLDDPAHSKHAWLQCMEEFAEEVGKGVFRDNTYNYDTQLDQGFQFVYFRRQDHDYVALHTHNGCDIRGGYARPHIFHVPEESEFFQWTVTVWCEGCDRDIDDYDEIDVIDPVEPRLVHTFCAGDIVWYNVAVDE